MAKSIFSNHTGHFCCQYLVILVGLPIISATLGTIFEQETGTRIFQEFDRRVASPLQMEDFHVGNCKYATWEDYHSAPYSTHGYYLFRMSTRDLARFGLLFLRQGQCKKHQIIPADWYIVSI